MKLFSAPSAQLFTRSLATVLFETTIRQVYSSKEKLMLLSLQRAVTKCEDFVTED